MRDTLKVWITVVVLTKKEKGNKEMPCYVTGSREGDLSLSLSEAQKEATRVTRMLCEVLRKLENKGRNIKVADFSDEVVTFWLEHKAIDKERQRREAEKAKRKAIRKNALRKLSKEEKEVLEILEDE